MKMRILLFLFLLISYTGFSQVMDTASLKAELNAIYERDQKVRKGDSAEFIIYIDSCNLAQVERMIQEHGWMGRSVIGGRGNYTLWLVVQHADLETQEKYFPLMKKSVEEGESRAVDLAYLEDRILMRKGKKQIYGTQVVPDENGNQIFFPIVDEKNVNNRRTRVGMETIEEYAKYFGIEYRLK